jgi:DNA anti-recombination protein RmuC
MQNNQYEKIRELFFKLIVETKELTEDEFQNIINQVFDANPTITKEMKEKLVLDIANMRNNLLERI